jgi:putative transposase
VLFATLADSEGQVEEIASPRYLRKAEKRLKRLQRRLSRCWKGSKGYEKVRLLLARQHEKVANQRRDFSPYGGKQSRRLVDHNRLLCLENLHVAGMLKNHRVCKSISDAAWGEFVRQCSYKGAWYGCEIQIVGRFFPSCELCNVCDRKNGGLNLSDRKWVCAWCRSVHKRDANAARNLLAEGKRNGRAGAAQTIQVNAGGEEVRPGIAVATRAASVKPEAHSL